MRPEDVLCRGVARHAHALEASNLANVPLYERYGFEVRGSFILPEDGPEVFTMWREAAPVPIGAATGTSH